MSYYCMFNLPYPVLFLGDAQGLCVFDSVHILRLLTAGRHHLSNASYWDNGQASAGLQRWPGWSWGVDHHSRPTAQWLASLLGTWAGSNCQRYISGSVCLQGEGLGFGSQEARWLKDNRRQPHYRHRVIIEGRPTFRESGNTLVSRLVCLRHSLINEMLQRDVCEIPLVRAACLTPQ